MWRSVQLSIHTSLRFYDDGKTELVRSECTGHEIEGFSIYLTAEEVDNLNGAVVKGKDFWKEMV